MRVVLLASVFVIATCGLIYELIAGAIASYLLGDSVTQFSTIIGVYLFSMGIGSYLSRYVTRNLALVFIQVEILVGLIGGFSAALLFVSFEYIASFRILLYALVSLTGTLVGLEIPILMRLLSDELDLKDLVAKVFTFDYVGALLASLLFPLVLVPHLGLVRSALMFGIFNVIVAFWAIHLFKFKPQLSRLITGWAAIATLMLGTGFVFADKIMSWAETETYQHTVVFSKSTPYQRIVLTKGGGDLRLYLNGNLQFSSKDEYRYHESLVHVGLRAPQSIERVLVLGGGDGLGLREILKYSDVREVTLVDLDPAMTKLFSSHEGLVELNKNSFSDPRVKVINADAFIWLKNAILAPDFKAFDFVVVDFPDPSNFSIGKLYSNTFYKVLYKSVKDTGGVVIQSTSPYVARKSFWCIDATLASVGFLTYPFHAYVPSFGEWGFVLAMKRPLRENRDLPEGLKFVSEDLIDDMFKFPADIAKVSTEVNKLNNQSLVRYFEDEWSEYAR